MNKVADFIASLKSLFMGPQELVGVYLGSHAVKIVWLAGGDKTCRLKGWAHAPLQFKADASPEEKKMVTARLIKDLFNRAGIRPRSAAVSVSGNAVIVRYVSIPKIAKKDLPLMLPAEAEPFIPFDIKDVQLGCHILGESSEEGQKKMQIALVAARSELISERMEVFRAADISPLVIDVDAFTLETICERMGGSHSGAVIMLNIGHKLTNLAIIENGITRVARDILIAGSSFTKTVSKNLGIETAKAEDIKRRIGIKDMAKTLPPSGQDTLSVTQDDQASAIISDIARDLAGEVRRSVDFYLSQGPDRAVSKAYITGGSSCMPNLAVFLSGELKVPVETLNPLSIISGSDAPPVPPELAPSLTVASGLALRRLWDWQ